MNKAAILASLSGVDLSEMQSAIQRMNSTMIDTSQVQNAFAKFTNACDNLSKVKINMSI